MSSLLEDRREVNRGGAGQGRQHLKVRGEVLTGTGASITLRDSDEDVVGPDEWSLLLACCNGSGGMWTDAASGADDRHPAQNWMSVPICHLSEFAFFGSEGRPTVLPLVIRSGH